METPKNSDFAHIGRSVIIKGELSGSEDLYVDGQVEGTILLQGNNLTVGPNGQLRANVNAKNVVIQGKLNGNVHASERTELQKSAVAVGDIFTQRISIEDGAFFQGKIDIQKEAAAKPAAPAIPKVEAVSSTRPVMPSAPVPAATAVAAKAPEGNPGMGVRQTPVTDVKKI